MRAHGLLSPHRGRQGPAKTHDGRVITQAPNVMWGTDGVRVFTLDDGWGWIFAAVEHWNAECVGWHVCKVGSRFAALDPIAQGLDRRYGSLDADVARGLALRMDHGSQYLSDHFLKQIRYWGIHPSFGFVEEPETNGVAGAVESYAQGASDPRPNLSETSRPSAPPWPTSWSGTTRPGVSRSLGITRRSRRARSMSYARRHSTNVCPGNRVRYIGKAQLAAWTLGTTVTVLLLLGGWGLYSLVGGLIVTQFSASLAAIARVVLRFSSALPTGSVGWSWARSRPLVISGLWVSVSQIAQTLLYGSMS